MVWKKIGKGASENKYDFLYRKINSDGTRERLRLVVYSDTPKGTVRSYYNKIKPTDSFFEGERQYEHVEGSSGWLYIKDIQDHFGISNEDFPDNRLNKVINAIKDIFNGNILREE